MRNLLHSSAAALVLCGLLLTPARAQKIEPAAVNLGRPVDFETDILPMLENNCIACHNVAISESKLNLEDVENIVKGGKRGAGIVPTDPEKSLIYQVAARAVEPAMPPLPNKVDATALTPQELGLLRQWILEGAGGGMGSSGRAVHWKSVPSTITSIYSVALSPWARFAAAGRANQIDLYDLGLGKHIGRLRDPHLDGIDDNGKPMYPHGAAHRDFVHSLAFSPDGQMLASGGYRVVKLWKRQDVKQHQLAGNAAVTAAAFSPDGQWLAVAAADNAIQLWNLADTAQPARTLAGHAGPVSGLEFSADGTKLVSSSHDQTIRIWNSADGSLIGRIDAPSPLNDVALNKDATLIVSAGADNLVRVWSMPGALPQQIPALPAPTITAANSADGKWLALGGNDGKVVLYDVAGGKPAHTLQAHTGAVKRVAFSGNSARLITSGADKLVRIWDVATAQQVSEVQSTLAETGAVALHPNGNQAVSALADNRVAVWKLDVPAPRALAGDNGIAPAVAVVSPDGKTLATAGTVDGKPIVLLRDIASGNVTRTLAGHEGPIRSLTYSADGARLASGAEDKTVRIWNAADGAEIAKIAGPNVVTAVALNSNGQQVVAGFADNALKLWNAADGAEVRDFPGHTGAVSAIAFTPDNQAVISASADQTIRVWNANDGQALRSIAHAQPVTALALSRDGTKLAATGTDQNVKLYQVGDGAVLATLAGHTAAAKTVAFSADNTRLVTSAADNHVIAWELATNTELERFAPGKGVTFALFADTPGSLLIGTDDKAITAVALHYESVIAGHTGPVTALVYAPDGGSIYSSSADTFVRRLQVANGQQLFAAQHGAAIHDLALSANGQWLASAGENNAVRVWNAGNGAPHAQSVLQGFEGPVRSVCFTPDSTRIVAGGDDKRVFVFRLEGGALEQRFAEHAGAVQAVMTGGDAAAPVIYSASADQTVRSASISAVRQIAGHAQPVTSVAFMPDGAQVLSGSADATVRVWDLASGNMVRQQNHGAAISGIAVRPDGQMIATSGANNMARLWDVNLQPKGEMKGSLKVQQQVVELTEADAIAKSQLALADAAVKAAEQNVKERDEGSKKAVEAKAAAEKALAEAETKAKAAADAAAAAATELAASTEDANLQKKKADADAAAAKEAEAAKQAKLAVESAARGVELGEKALQDANARQAEAKAAHEAAIAAQKQTEESLNAGKAQQPMAEKPVQSVAFSRDGSVIATCGEDNLVHLWDGNTAKPLETLAGHEAPVRALAFGPNGLLASGGDDNRALVWNTAPAWEFAGVLGPSAETPLDLASSPFIDRVLALGFSPDGKLLATGGGEPSRSGELILWNVESRAPVHNLADAHSDTVFGLEFSRDGKLLASGAADKFVKVFNVETGKHVRSFEGHTHHVLDVSWQADGSTLASAGADNAIKVWNVESGEQKRTISNYTKQVTGVQFLGTGLNIVSASGDANVRFHRTNDGGNYRNFGGAADFVYSVAAARDESLVIAGGEDGILRVWNGTNAQVLFSFEPPKVPEAAATAEVSAAK